MYLVSKVELAYSIRQFDLLNPSCSQRVLDNQSMKKSQHDRHAKDRICCQRTSDGMQFATRA